MVRLKLLKRHEVASPDFIGIAMTGWVSNADNKQSIAGAGLDAIPGLKRPAVRRLGQAKAGEVRRLGYFSVAGTHAAKGKT